MFPIIVAVAHLDAGVGQRLARLFVFGFAAARRRIRHDAHLHAAAFRRNHRAEQRFIGQQEHAMFNDVFAALMASMIGLVVSSGRTISVCDMEMTCTLGRCRCYFSYFTRLIGDAFQVPSIASAFGQ